MHKVNVNGKLLYAEDGELLSALLMRHGMKLAHPCGGRGICRKCTVSVNGTEVLSCRYPITSDISVLLPQEDTIVSESGATESGKITQNLCFALDIGTTTLALALVSLDDHQIVRVSTAVNPQKVFGADVISRINYCKKHGTKELQEILIEQIDRMIAEFCVPRVEALYVAGNTTMLHLFLGVDCSSIGAAPYTPAFLNSKRLPAEELKITGVRQVITLPGISSFVGADLVAGLNYVGTPPVGKYRLLVDLGTNAEVVLYSQESGLCTAAAAGPCFEGTNISCGMSATKGAIRAFAINEQGQKLIQTIEDAPPRGLCGTGLIDAVAALLEREELDETGRLENDPYPLTDHITLTQGDVRQFQLAKSAVCAAILTLMHLQNISFDQIECVYLSGGFSAHIDLQNAARTGLLPPALTDRCVSVNNSSLLGTVKYAYEANDLTKYTNRTQYADLSADPYFSEAFIEQMLF